MQYKKILRASSSGARVTSIYGAPTLVNTTNADGAQMKCATQNMLHNRVFCTAVLYGGHGSYT
jgi:hypothetical protein